MSRNLPSKREVIYFDNNSTTRICKNAANSVVKWLDSRSNPSTDSIISKNAKEMILNCRKFIAKFCGVPMSGYSIIFTSGASESNCCFLRSVVNAYKSSVGKKPHIITSAIEHRSILDCCKDLVNSNIATVTYIEPNGYGVISPLLIEKAINSNTAIISIMYANNEIGTINDIKKIGEIAHEHKIPFHTDAVQIFGKYAINMVKSNIDALSMSFHKICGPMGIGLLIIKNELIEGYGMKGIISGTQQYGLRGGTENVPAIAGAFAAIEYYVKDMDKKNQRIYNLKEDIIRLLEKQIPMGKYEDYFGKTKKTQNEFVVLGPVNRGDWRKPNVMPTTLLLSFVKNNVEDPIGPDKFCNIKLKKFLDKNNIIVSIGSACSTKDPNASHVLYAIKAPEVIRAGVIRISINDKTTVANVSVLCKKLIEGVKKQMTIS